MSSEEQQGNKAEEKPSQIQQETYYQRKKNWIGGIDNDTLLLLGVASAIGLGAIAASPIIRDLWTNFTSRMQNQQPQQQPYIPPTAPVPAITNGHEQPQQQVPIEQNQQQPIEPVIQPQAPAPQQPRIDDEDDDDDGVFYEKELKRKQQLMGRRPTGSKYESPFGKDIGGLG